MNGYHVFWSTPKLIKSDSIVFSKVEFLTLLVGILKFQQNNGNLRLITDSRGLQFFERTELANLYKGGISVELNNFNFGINPAICWSAGKVWAHQFADNEVCIDLDAILWKKLPNFNTNILCINFDGLDWPSYNTNSANFAAFDNGFDWGVKPINAGLLYIKNKVFRNYYSNYVTFCNRLYSNNSHPNKNISAVAPVFFEQQMLAMLARQASLSVSDLCTLNPNLQHHIQKNDFITHLWGTKFLYFYSCEARTLYQNFLKNIVKNEFSWCNNILEHNNLHKITSFEEEKYSPRMEKTAITEAKKYGLVKKIHQINGKVKIHDPNVASFRYAVEGEDIYWAETLEGKASLIDLKTK